ncbi:MAG: hypothetical protein JJE04_09760, partial [Acidobacteriia bacterium]|nr:hypothetical protein [Terriglobia bacterium]
MTLMKWTLLLSLCVVIALPLASQTPAPGEKGSPLFKQGSKDTSDPNMREVAGV